MEKINKKIASVKSSLVFNRTCIKENLLPKYTNIHIYMYIYIYIYIYMHIVFSQSSPRTTALIFFPHTRGNASIFFHKIKYFLGTKGTHAGKPFFYWLTFVIWGNQKHKFSAFPWNDSLQPFVSFSCYFMSFSLVW